jgi:2-polyprenyl-6-methoxyphenol hydroxylase-like FAD-dependent oxidoreductase
MKKVYYPKLKEYNWATSNFLLDPQHFPMIAQIANDGLLRITYGEEGNLTKEQMLERQPWKYKQFVPGAPEPNEYKITNFSPYKIHQRCAEGFRVGRFLLTADAAHLCNPL